MFSNPRNAVLANLQVIDSKDVNHIRIQYLSDSIFFYPSLDNNIVIEEYMESPRAEKFAQVQIEHDKLNVFSGNRNQTSFFDLSEQNNYIYVYIPLNYAGSLAVETNSGSICFNNEDSTNNLQDYDVHMNDMSAISTSGSITFSNMVLSNTVYMRTSSGSIKGQNIMAKNLEVTTTSGSIKFDNLTSKKVLLSSKSGSIHVYENINTEFLTIDVVSGSIKLNKVETARTVLSAKTGSINAKFLAGDFDISTVAGSLKIETLLGLGVIDTKVGSIHIENITEIFGDIYLSSKAGSIKFNTDNALNFYGHIKNGLGGARVFFADEKLREYAQYSDAIGDIREAKHNITVEVATGSINWGIV